MRKVRSDGSIPYDAAKRISDELSAEQARRESPERPMRKGVVSGESEPRPIMLTPNELRAVARSLDELASIASSPGYVQVDRHGYTFLYQSELGDDEYVEHRQKLRGQESGEADSTESSEKVETP